MCPLVSLSNFFFTTKTSYRSDISSRTRLQPQDKKYGLTIWAKRCANDQLYFMSFVYNLDPPMRWPLLSFGILGFPAFDMILLKYYSELHVRTGIIHEKILPFMI